MGSKSKKGRNPGAVDSWLDSIGLYRKNVAYDETCLFRSVSEQLFECQIYHERVRKECVEYGRSHYYEFWNLLETEEEWYEHMDLLEKHMVVCGNIEMQIISYKYDRDIIVFDAARTQSVEVTNRNLEKRLMLCLMNEDHYDVVYNREHIQNAGFCQSIVYNTLYENVFKVPNVQDIVHGMLYEKEFVSSSFSEINNNNNSNNNSVESTAEEGETKPPFPFKVAKALDPTIYRNIEYDSWTEVRRDMRLGDWYYGDDNLILGTRCILNDNDETYECYIQEIIKNQNKCIVYVTKLAEKRTVNYTDLSPENDAKPWPLPYRFSKNLTVSSTQTSEKNIKLPKKRKDKRRLKTNSESSAQSHNMPTVESVEADIKAFFAGVPLQMQNGDEPQFSPQESPVEPPQQSLSQHNLLVTPEIHSPMPKFSWEAPWNNYSTMGQDQVIWSHSPGPFHGMMNYSIKPMIASAPVTPDVVPYHDTHYPYVYNYHVENYNAYNSWGATNEYSSDGVAVQQSNEVVAQTSEQENSKEKRETHQHHVEHHYHNHSIETNYESREQRPTLCTAMSPSSPQVEIYSPIMPIPPGTPVIYTHGPEMAEMMLPSTPVQVFTPPVDVQYVSPGPYIYPPTPPTGWYPPGLNSQGFIFPAPINQNIHK